MGAFALNFWIGPPGSSLETATYVPPFPDELISRMNSWFEWWKERHASLQSQSKEIVIAALAEFHHRNLQIHPFLDANGRLARTLLDQAARELLNQGVAAEFTDDAPAYYATLVAADNGDHESLKSRIAATPR